MQTLSLKTRYREQLLDITAQVQEAIEQLGIKDGACLVYSPHTTAGITINENSDPDVVSDILKWMRETIPQDGGFRHGEGNADAHIKTTLVGPSQWVPVSGGRLALGRWQAIYFCEFDGPRTRQVHVSGLRA